MTAWNANWQALVSEVMASPKTTAVVAGSSAGLGTAAALDIIHGTLAVLAVAAGVLASLTLARYHMANERHMRLKNKMLAQQLRDSGIDPDKD